MHTHFPLFPRLSDDKRMVLVQTVSTKHFLKEVGLSRVPLEFCSVTISGRINVRARGNYLR